MYVVAYETSSNKELKFLLDHALSMDNVCNRRLFSIPSKVEMAEEQGYLETSCNDVVLCCAIDDKSNLNNCKF